MRAGPNGRTEIAAAIRPQSGSANAVNSAGVIFATSYHSAPGCQYRPIAPRTTSRPGVSPSRTHQIVPGALVAEAVMDIFDLPELQVCPWALREGVILDRLDQLAGELLDKGHR